MCRQHNIKQTIWFILVVINVNIVLKYWILIVVLSALGLDLVEFWVPINKVRFFP